MSESNEMYEGIESVINDMLEGYKNTETYTDAEWYRREGSIETLVSLLEKSNE